MPVAGDARTASDALMFLQGFMQRFPAYQGRPFWIAGESYGGESLAMPPIVVNCHIAVSTPGGKSYISLPANWGKDVDATMAKCCLYAVRFLRATLLEGNWTRAPPEFEGTELLGQGFLI